MDVPIVVDEKGKNMDYGCDDVLSFWKGADFTLLPLIVRIICGSMPGSGALENDFGLCNKCLNKWRSTLASQNFGMTMTLNRNLNMITEVDFLNGVEIIPWNKVCQFKEMNEPVVLKEDDTVPTEEETF